MNTINILDKTKADLLASKGFKYTAQKINSSDYIYVFFETNELLKELNSQFGKNDYFVSKIMCL